MLRLPHSLVIDICTRANKGSLTALSAVNRALHDILNDNETIIRLYLQRQGPSIGRAGAYELLTCQQCRAWSRGESAEARAARLVQLMLDYQAALRRTSDKEGRRAALDNLSLGNGSDIRQLLAVLPYSEHCLLPFCAHGGHVELVKALLPLTQAVLSVHSAVHYVKTSAFFAAAAGEVYAVGRVLSA